MKTTVTIDDELMDRAMRLSGSATHRAATEAGLRLLIRFSAQAKLRDLKGKVSWEGDLDQMKTD